MLVAADEVQQQVERAPRTPGAGCAGRPPGSVDSTPSGTRGRPGPRALAAASGRRRLRRRRRPASSDIMLRRGSRDRVAELHRRRTSSMVARGRLARAARCPRAGCPRPCRAARRTRGAGRGSRPCARGGDRPAGPCSRGSRCRRCGSPAAAQSCVSAVENALCRSNTGQTSGSPGSVRRTRAGSVTIGFSFCAHGLGRVLQEDGVAVRLRHLPPVGPGRARRRGQQRLRLREHGPVEVVEAPHHLARQLDVRGLVLAHRHRVRPVDHDVGALQQRVAEEAVGREVRLRAAAAGPCSWARAPARARGITIESSRCSSACSGHQALDEERRRARGRARRPASRRHLQHVLARSARGSRSRWSARASPRSRRSSRTRPAAGPSCRARRSGGRDGAAPVGRMPERMRGLLKFFLDQGASERDALPSEKSAMVATRSTRRNRAALVDSAALAF